MLDQLEIWSKAHEQTIQLFIAITTAAAVVISLYASRKRPKPKLRCYLSIMFRTDRSDERFLSVSLTNIGEAPARVAFDFFRWEVPFAKYSGLVAPMAHFTNERQFPVPININCNELISISPLDTHLQGLDEMSQTFKCPKRFLRYIVKGKVLTEDGQSFPVKINKNYKEKLFPKPL